MTAHARPLPASSVPVGSVPAAPAKLRAAGALSLLTWPALDASGVDAAVTAVFLVLVAVVVLANARVWRLLLSGRREPDLREEPFVAASGADQTS